MSEPIMGAFPLRKFTRETLDVINEMPYIRWAGLRFTEVGSGYSRMELRVAPHHRGGGGTAAVNGGILAYMVDISAGLTLMTTWTEADRSQVTINMHVQYLKPAYGDVIVAESRVLDRGRTIGTVETEIRGPAGEVCTKAISTYRIFPRPVGTADQRLGGGDAGAS